MYQLGDRFGRSIFPLVCSIGSRIVAVSRAALSITLSSALKNIRKNFYKTQRERSKSLLPTFLPVEFHVLPLVPLYMPFCIGCNGDCLLMQVWSSHQRSGIQHKQDDQPRKIGTTVKINKSNVHLHSPLSLTARFYLYNLHTLSTITYHFSLYLSFFMVIHTKTKDIFTERKKCNHLQFLQRETLQIPLH